jgi:NhaP-type Na+/H+ or K+/H+ antiporter
LATAGISGADKLLPATFLVIVGTVTVYGLTAAPVAGLLGLTEAREETEAGPEVPPALDIDDAETGEDQEEP